MERSDSFSSDASSIEFSPQNGLVFQTVLDNPSRFNLTATDKLLLEDGRDAMATRTRYGFLVGATLSPLPLFRGQYAINNLRNLPPLMDPQTQRPNPTVIRARLFWIAQSIVLTTLGSGLGTWIGFKIGLKAMQRKLESIPGCRERVMDAFNQAQRELESSSLNHQPQDRSPSTPKSLSASTTSSRASLSHESEDDNSFRETEEITPRVTPSASSSNRDTQSSPASQSDHSPTSSRWEELRRAPQSRQSTWQTIREQNTRRQAPPPPSNQHIFPANPNQFEPRSQNEVFSPAQTQEEFEKLLDRERNLSAGISPQISKRNASSESP